jgi:hypothetical protein
MLAETHGVCLILPTQCVSKLRVVKLIKIDAQSALLVVHYMYLLLSQRKLGSLLS